MVRGGRGFAVIAGDLGNDRNFLWRQMGPRMFLDQLGRPLVMAFSIRRLRPPDVMEERGAVQKLPLACVPLMPGGQTVENLQSECGNMIGVARLLVVTGAERKAFLDKRGAIFQYSGSSSRIAAVSTP